jgi:hypothetical protein
MKIHLPQVFWMLSEWFSFRPTYASRIGPYSSNCMAFTVKAFPSGSSRAPRGLGSIKPQRYHTSQIAQNRRTPLWLLYFPISLCLPLNGRFPCTFFLGKVRGPASLSLVAATWNAQSLKLHYGHLDTHLPSLSLPISSESSILFRSGSPFCRLFKL